MKKTVVFAGFVGFFWVVWAGSAMAQQPPPTRLDTFIIQHMVSGFDARRVYTTDLLITNRRSESREVASWDIKDKTGRSIRTPAQYDGDSEIKNFSGSSNGGRPEMLPIPANGIRRITILPEGYDPNLGPCQGSGELKPSWAYFTVPSTLTDRGYDGVRFWLYETDLDIQVLITTINCATVVTSAVSTPAPIIVGRNFEFTMPVYHHPTAYSSGVAVAYPTVPAAPDIMDVEFTLRGPDGRVVKNPDGTSAVTVVRMETGRLQQLSLMIYQIFPKLQGKVFFGTLGVRLIKVGRYDAFGAVWGLRIDNGEDDEVRMSNLTATLK